MNLNKIANFYNIKTKFVQNIHICILIENTHFFHHKFRQMLFYAWNFVIWPNLQNTADVSRILFIQLSIYNVNKIWQQVSWQKLS